VKILITGAAGDIGSKLTNDFQPRYPTVYEGIKAIEFLKSDVKFY